MKKSVMVFLVFLLSLTMNLVPVNASEIEDGKAFYEKNRCNFCHKIEGKGGKMASDLSNIGSKRDHEWLMAFFKNPKKIVPGVKMMRVKGSDAQLSALAAYLLSHK